MRALRSLTLLLALTESSAALFGQQKRNRELRGARLLGAASGGAAGFRLSSQAMRLFQPGGMAVFPVRRLMFTAPQQAALASVAALSGLYFTEVVANQEHGVARALRRVGLWLVEVRRPHARARHLLILGDAH